MIQGGRNVGTVFTRRNNEGIAAESTVCEYKLSGIVTKSTKQKSSYLGDGTPKLAASDESVGLVRFL